MTLLNEEFFLHITYAAKNNNAVEYQQGEFTRQGARGCYPKQKIINKDQKYTEQTKDPGTFDDFMSGDITGKITFTLTTNQALFGKTKAHTCHVFMLS